MESYYLPASSTTPAIKFDPAEGVLSFQGDAVPENAVLLFADVFHKLVEFTQSSLPSLNVVFDFENINTGSSKCVFDLIKSLGDISDMGKKVTIQWVFDEDNEQMLDTGMDIEEMMLISDFRLVPKATVMI